MRRCEDIRIAMEDDSWRGNARTWVNVLMFAFCRLNSNKVCSCNYLLFVSLAVSSLADNIISSELFVSQIFTYWERWQIMLTIYVMVFEQHNFLWSTYSRTRMRWPLKIQVAASVIHWNQVHCHDIWSFAQWDCHHKVHCMVKLDEPRWIISDLLAIPWIFVLMF
jgi:hypothetical protein